MLGAMLFVFYQFQPNTPVFFNQTEWRRHVDGPQGAAFRAIEQKHAAVHAEQQEKIRAWVAARDRGEASAEAAARTAMLQAQEASNAVKKEARDTLLSVDPKAKIKDSDYVFITFILTELPHGVIGLLIAVMFASTLSSKAGELNALGTTSTIDLWRHFRPLKAHDEARNVRNAKWFTALWGLFAISFALFVEFRGRSDRVAQHRGFDFLPGAARCFRGGVLPEKSWRARRFSGRRLRRKVVVLALFLLGKVYPSHEIGYLWFNPIGCLACVIFSLILQRILGHGKTSEKSTA